MDEYTNRAAENHTDSPKNSPLITTVPTVIKLNVVHTLLRADDFRTPHAITTENRRIMYKILFLLGT